jgi:hypothetical protein
MELTYLLNLDPISCLLAVEAIASNKVQSYAPSASRNAPGATPH